MIELDAIILAAGLSKRMGCNKLLLPFAASTILEHFLDHFPYQLFQKTILVYSHGRVAELAKGYPLQCVENNTPERGQSSSLHRGCLESRARDGMLYAVADQPLLKAGSIARLCQAASKHPGKIIRPLVFEKPANPVLFPAALRSQLLALSGDEGGRQLIKAHPELLQNIPFTDLEQFFDIDTPERYQQLLSIYGGRE